MSIVNGTIEAYSNKYGKHSILVGGKWYSSKFEIKASKGDSVEFDDKDKGYVNALKVLSAGSSPATKSSFGGRGAATVGFPVGFDTKDRSIVRQNSLSNAVKLVSDLGLFEIDANDGGESMEKVALLCVNVARIFEAYSSGDEDAKEAAKLLEES